MFRLNTNEVLKSSGDTGNTSLTQLSFDAAVYKYNKLSHQVGNEESRPALEHIQNAINTLTDSMASGYELDATESFKIVSAVGRLQDYSRDGNVAHLNLVPGDLGES